MQFFIHDQKGNILVFAVVAMLSVLLFASMSIDVGCVLTAKNQLQCAVDASALAGATGLNVNQSEAVNRAISIAGRNRCIKQSVLINAEDVSFPNSDQIRVQTNRNVNLFFARVVGINTMQISAVAAAELGTIIETRGMRPWAVPDLSWPRGTPVIIKAGSKDAPATNPSFYYPIDFPPLNRGTPVSGADAYRKNIINGSSSNVTIGDELLVEPGNMVGPTKQGVLELIDLDPYVYWDGDQVVNSSYPGTSSPRIVKIPLYDPDYPPDSGRNSVTVVGLASFFLVGMQGKDVIGVFMEKMTDGNFGSGNSLLRGVRLVL